MIELIDRIYESAVLPEKWPGVLDELGRIVECDKAFIFTTDGREITSYVYNTSAKDACTDLSQNGWMRKNPMGQRTIQRREPRFTVDLDIFTPEERKADPFYNDFLIPHGAAWGTGSLVLSPGRDFTIFSLHREEKFGPVALEKAQLLTNIRPHLARAALLSTQLATLQARSLVNTLDALGLPAATLRRSGALHVANCGFQKLVPSVVADFRSRLKFIAPGADAVFEEAVTRHRTHVGTPGSVSFPVPSSETTIPPYIAHLVPVAGAGRDVFSEAVWILVAVPLTLHPALGPLMLEGLFDLTPAEARVARGISLGQTLRDIAGQHAIGFETVRSQLKSVFAKTGTHQQHELAALLSTPIRSEA